MLNALWKHYGHCAAQLCKSRLLTKLKDQTVTQPALSLAACFPVSQVHLVNHGTEQRLAQHYCSESVFPTPSIFPPVLPKAPGKWTPVDAYRRSCRDKCFKAHPEEECHLLRITGSNYCRTLRMDGESSETMCEQLAHWKYLQREESRPRAFFSFSLAGLQANE